jgi:hypothetical protein
MNWAVRLQHCFPPFVFWSVLGLLGDPAKCHPRYLNSPAAGIRGMVYCQC